MNRASSPVPRVEAMIYLIRDQRVMLDSDLAGLYGVETKTLNRAVSRNRARFPPDFAYQLEAEDVVNLRCQIGTSSSGYGGRRYRPWVFTEQGVAMLSGVLRSQRAIQVNIAIMRAFVRLREALMSNIRLATKLAEMERKVADHDDHIQALFDAVRQLMLPPDPPRKKIGFNVEEPRVIYGCRIQRR